MLSVTFCGAARTVTGSQYFLEYVDKDGSKFNFCVDSGLFQVGQKINLFKINSYLLFDPKKLDAIVLTHAHLDHCGRIPYLVKMGFGGRIYSTEATKKIAEIVMLDSARMSTDENLGGDGTGGLVENFEMLVDSQIPAQPSSAQIVKPRYGKNSGNQPKTWQGKILVKENLDLYQEEDVFQTMTRFRTYAYHQKFLIHPNLEVEFYDAGHIIGSAFVKITELSTGRNIVFSGDLGNIHKPIIEDPEMPQSISNLTHIFTETTYGNKVHCKKDPKEKLRLIIRQTLKRRGKLLIPAFSVERAQEVIYYIVELMQENKVNKVPIYLDSPMASKVLKVCLEHPELYDNDLKQKIIEKANPLIYKNLVVLESVEQSKALNNRHTPCIIIAGSGMMTGGRILKHLQFNIENPLNTILIVGYQAEGTLGRQIVEGAREVEIEGRQFKVLAEIQAINEFSAHADQSILKRWISGMVSGNHGTKTRIFLMHGEKEASLGLSLEIESGLFNQAESYWPRFGEKVQLWD